MGRIAWYKRDPRAALTGMMELSLDERGAYNTVLDLIYDRAGDLPDDDRFIAGWCRCDLRVWRRIKERLLSLGKLYIEDGKIRNERADRGLLDALHRAGSAAEAGRASGRKRKSETNENNDIEPTTVPTDVKLYKEERSKKERKSESDGAIPRPAKAAVWNEMKGLIANKNPGALVGRWCRDYGEEFVLAAHFAAMKSPRADYVSWMAKHLMDGAKARAVGPKGAAADARQTKATANGHDVERRREAEERCRAEGINPMTREGLTRVSELLRQAA